MPLKKKWRSMEVLNFGSGHGGPLQNFLNSRMRSGSKENLSRSSGSQNAGSRTGSRENLSLDHNHNHSSRNQSRSLRSRLGSLSNVREDIGSPRQRDTLLETPAGYIQRCAIIQKDERGYGFTVRGDNPVYVEIVKPDGAAAKAGVQQGDRIIKVNGTLVTNSNHLEVVKLIKSGSFVALTLLNKPPGGNQTPSDKPQGASNRLSGVGPPKEIVTAPQPVDAHKSLELKFSKVVELQKYYELAVKDFEECKKNYQKSPSEKLNAQLQEKEKTLETLKEQVNALSSSLPPDYVPPSHQIDDDQPSSSTPWLKGGPKHVKTGSTPATIYASDAETTEAQVGVSRSMSDAGARQRDLTQYRKIPKQKGDTELTKTRKGKPFKLRKTTSLPNTSVDVGSISDSPHNSPSASPTPLHPGNPDDPDTRQELSFDDPSQGMSHRPQQDIIAVEDDEFESDEEHARTDDHGPFNDLRQLESKSAHSAIFLNFLLMENHNPSAFLFYLTTNVYQATTGSAKELKKWAFEIHSTFTVYGAPLKINVEDNLAMEIDKVLQNKSDKEEALKVIFLPTRLAVTPEIQSQLQTFRQKKDMGMGNMFGAHEVRENMKKSEEMEVIAKYLIKHMDKALQSDFEETIKSDRELAIYWALSTFLRFVGANKSNSNLDKVPSFVLKERKLASIQKVSFRYSGKPKTKTQRGHTFLAHSYNKVEQCAYCGKVIWGIGHQGYQCQACETNVHRQCIDELEEMHSCNKKKRQSRFAIRKSTPAPLRDSEKDAGSPVPQSNTVFSIQSARDEDDADLANMKGDTHSVSKLVSRFDNIQGLPGQEKKRSPSQLSEPESNQRKGSDLGRSESLKGRADTRGDRPTRRAKSDVDMDENALRALNNSGSSSTSSLSNRSVGDSPSNSLDAVNSIPPAIQEDSDFEVEQELPPLKSVLSDEVYKKLKPKERKRQDVINELFYTERSHVRNLKIMDTLFYKQMCNDSNIPDDFIKLLFPNLEDMIQLHCCMNNEMKSRRKENKLVDEVGDILLRRFDHEPGEAFRTGCAIFCRNQSHALDMLRSRQKKDVRLSQLIADAESSFLMRRLQLRDLIPTQMMRLTKYPLLIENLLKYTRDQSEEHNRLQRALQCCRHILEYVNQAVKDYENIYRLEQIQRRIEKKVTSDAKDEEWKMLDLRKHKLVYEGSLTWNMNQRKSVDVHVVLLEDILVLLQKQDDKFVLKSQSTQLVAGKDDSKYMFSPLLKLDNVLHTNSKATDKKAFFVVSKSQIYELSAHTADEQRKWCKFIKEAADAHKDKDIKARRAEEPPGPVETNQVDTSRTNRITGGSDFHEQISTSEEPTLVQPEEIITKDPLTATALPLLTPIEKLRRLDADIRDKLKEKHLLVAKVLGIPEAEMSRRAKAALDAGNSDSISDLILSLAQESEDCINLINTAEESGLAKEDLTMPIPMDKLRDMANRMNQILTNLLEKTRAYNALTAGSNLSTAAAVVNSRDEERERLRRELKAAQDELNMLREIQRRVSSSSPTEVPVGRPQSFVSEPSTLSDAGDENTMTQMENVDTELEIIQAQSEELECERTSDLDRQDTSLESSAPTEIPQEIDDILTDGLSVTEPPEEESLEDVDPRGITEEELTNPVEDYVDSEMMHVVEESEVISETVEELPVTNGEGSSVDVLDRRNSEETFEDATDKLNQNDENCVIENGDEEVAEQLEEEVVVIENSEEKVNEETKETDGLEKSDTEKLQDENNSFEEKHDCDLSTDIDNEKLRTDNLCDQEIIKSSETNSSNTGDSCENLLLDNRTVIENSNNIDTSIVGEQVESSSPGEDLTSPVDI